MPSTVIDGRMNVQIGRENRTRARPSSLKDIACRCEPKTSPAAWGRGRDRVLRIRHRPLRLDCRMLDLHRPKANPILHPGPTRRLSGDQSRRRNRQEDEHQPDENEKQNPAATRAGSEHGVHPDRIVRRGP